MDRSELGALDAVTTAAHIAAGSLSAREVVEAAIARTGAVEPTLNAVAAEMFAAALSRSDAPPPGPFAGVPTFIKDLEDEEGVVNGHGSRVYRNHVATRTEPFVREFQAIGLVSLGRSASPEFGLDATTEPLAHGPTRNPWNPDYSTGGSSGGAAALVAARAVPIAHGSDAAGSIRIPASHCGLIGLKPTRGRGFEPAANSRLPVPTLTNGVLTRTVTDTAHFLAAIEDRMPSPSLPPVGKVVRPKAERLRIGVFTDSPLGFEVDGDVKAATLEAAARCETSLGHAVEKIGCPYDGQLVHDIWTNLGFVAWVLRLQTRLRRGADPDQLEPWTHGLADGWKRQVWRYPAVARRLRGASDVSRGLWDRFDLLMCPTLAAPPPRIGELGPKTPFQQKLDAEMRHMPFAPIQNVTGEPALSLPLGVSRAGLPIGVQFVAPPGREADLLSIALELEDEGAFHMLT